MTQQPSAELSSLPSRPVVYRHTMTTRIWHWLNVAIIIIMLMSGAAIFNAHPRLYWGSEGASAEAAWLTIGSDTATAGDEHGYIAVGDMKIKTTGVLGYWSNPEGKMRKWAFPYWATLPSDSNLALARRWHLTFAWAFAFGMAYYLIWTLVRGHMVRKLLPGRRELRPAHLLRDCRDHAMLKFPCGEKARDYNVLQKLTYLSVLLILLPGLILSGLGMSPGMNASWPWILDLFGGRQSARSFHFIFAVLLILFVVVHVLMILASGPLNHLRSMITGRYKLPAERAS